MSCIMPEMNFNSINFLPESNYSDYTLRKRKKTYDITTGLVINSTNVPQLFLIRSHSSFLTAKNRIVPNEWRSSTGI